MTSPGHEVAEPNTPGGVIAGTGALARGLSQPAYHGSTFRATLVLGAAFVTAVIVVVTFLLVRG